MNDREAAIAIAVTAVLILAGVIIASGALVWALGGGALAAVVLFVLSRNPKASLAGGSATFGLILVLGIFSWLSPGWYEHLM